MASEVADLWVRLRLLGGDFSKGLKEAGAEAEGFNDKVTKSLQKVAKIGAVGLVGLGVASVKMAGDWQESMIRLTTSAGEAGSAMHGKLTGEIAHVSDALLKMAVQTGTSTKELASGMYYVESAGFHGADGINVMRIAAEGAKAEGADLSVVADGLTTVLHDMGMTADQAVPAMNMMVRAVGDGKTTMQDFSASLAAVLPAAHAAGLSFPDVAAAIATMTAAGNTAQHSADMLGHTISSLQTPNAQAVKWMSQMGLSATDLKENLGARGLLGTITEVDQAILSHMGKDGEVLQSAFNKSKSAASDLNVMLGQMPPQLKKWSEAVVNGTMTAKDYNKITGDIPANLKAQASEFLTLYKNASGFNQALRSGTPDVDTFAGMLKKVLGDSVDTNTALQIGGQNLAYYAKTAADVAAAGRQAGNDIETWGTITQGFNFRVSQARELLQTTAIRIGTDLLPKLMDLMDFISRKGGPVLHEMAQNLSEAFNSHAMQEAEDILITFFHRFVITLKDTWQATLNLWHALEPTAAFLAGAFFFAIKTVGIIMADVLGPAIKGVTGYLKDHAGVIKFLAEVALAALIAKLLYTKTIVAIDMFTNFVNGIQKAATAFLDFGTKVATGQVFDTIRLKAMYAGDAIKNLAGGEREAAAAGEAAAGAQGVGKFMGVLAGGGAILAAGALGIGLIANAFDDAKTKGQEASASADQFVAAMSRTAHAPSDFAALGNAAADLKILNDALSGTLTQNEKLEGQYVSDMGDAFDKLHNSTIRNVEPMAQLGVELGKVNQVSGEASGTLKAYDAGLAQMIQSGGAGAARAQDLIAQIKGVDDAQGKALINIDRDFPQAVAALHGMAAQQALNAMAAGTSTDALNTNTTALDNTTGATNSLADATANAFQQQQDMSAGLNADRALDDYNKAVQALTQSFKDNGSSIKGTSQAAMNNRDALRQSVQTIIDTYNANLQNNVSQADATKKLQDQIKQLINQSSQSDATRKAVQEYIDTLNIIPASVTSNIDINTSAAEAKLKQYQADLNAAITNAGVGNQVMTPGHTQLHHYDVGGFVSGPRGAPQLAVVHGGEYVVSLDEQTNMGTTGAAAQGSPMRGGGGGLTVHFHIEGSVIAERDLRDLVQTQMLQLGARFSTSYTPYKR